MTHLENLVNQVKSKQTSASKYPIKANYYPYKTVSHTIRIKNGTVVIRLSDKLQDAPDEILESIITILFNKLFRVKTSLAMRKTYRDYINTHIIPNINPAERKISKHYKAKGNYFDLDTVFEKINNIHFNSSIKKPHLGWSLNKSIRRLGFYDHERNLLVVSKVFDHRNVPAYVVDYIMYHEMLHILFPVERQNGRRIVHSKEFKNQEIRFPEYTMATKWINKKLWRLKFVF